VRCDELNFRSSTPTSGSTTKLQHILLTHRVSQERILGYTVNVAGNQGGCFDNMC
jgi:hypothetical protein